MADPLPLSFRFGKPNDERQQAWDALTDADRAAYVADRVAPAGPGIVTSEMAARLFNMDDVRQYFDDNQAELGNELKQHIASGTVQGAQNVFTLLGVDPNAHEAGVHGHTVLRHLDVCCCLSWPLSMTWCSHKLAPVASAQPHASSQVFFASWQRQISCSHASDWHIASAAVQMSRLCV